ncbi:MAG: leucine-rich repeat protein [Clostridia bacterium]|nr:leucine-rich repeat protein [Clostridia bacterium]
MQKKKCWLWFLFMFTFVFTLSLFSLTACKDTNEEDKLYLGTYKGGSDTFIITEEYVNINGEDYEYTMVDGKLRVESFNVDLNFHNNYQVLSFDFLAEFDSGSITERNQYFDVTLYNYDGNAGIVEFYTFKSDGTALYVNASDTIKNKSATYRIKDGVIEITFMSIVTFETNKTYWYVTENGQIYYDVYIKDLDTYFNDNNGNNPNDNNNGNSSTPTPSVEFYEVTFDYRYEQKEENINIQEGSSIELRTLEREGYTFCGWLINGETKNGGDIIMITENIRAHAQWTENRYTITYNLSGGQMPYDGVMYDYAIYNLPYHLPIPQGADTQSFVKWTTDEAGENEIKTITELGNYTLYAHYEDSAKFLTYKYSEELQGYEVSDYTGNGKSVKIPSTYKGVAVKGVGDNAFEHYSSLMGIEIPDGVTRIGYDAFGNCSGLTNINIPSTVTFIGPRAFRSCLKLTSVEIPDGVTEICDSTFQACVSLESVKIPKGITSIGSWSFLDCHSLKSIEIPNSVTYISVGAFKNCGGLTSVKIPAKITTIYQEIFQDCLALKTIIIDSSYVANVSFIGDIITYATDVYIRADITVTASIYNVIFNNLGIEEIGGVEYYHYQIKGE